MRNPKENRAGCDRLGHNCSWIEGAAVPLLWFRKDDPWRCNDREIALATEVLRKLPEGVPLPVVANGEGAVLIGHIFVEAARRLGLERILIIRHEGLTAQQEKHYTVAINQLLGKGGWDPVGLEVWIREFEAGIEDFSHLMLGFDNGELDKILGIPKQIAGGNADDVPSLQKVAVSRHGMLWQAGRHLVLVGDATKREHFERLMAGHVGKLALTDPPFGCKIDGFVTKKGTHRDFVQGAGELSPEELEALFFAFCSNLALVLRKGALVYLFIDWRSLDLLLRAGGKVFGPLVHMCCWVKDRAGMGSFYRSQHELVLVFRVPGGPHQNNVQLGRNARNRSNVWDYPSAASSRSGREGDMLKHHPTPKTVEMIADAILDSTEPGERVVDCFLGSGTTLIAAERTGRICHAMDLDPLYVDVAIRRWQAWTGLAAVDLETGKTFDEISVAREQGGDEGDV
jgi:DNA modification methylase